MIEENSYEESPAGQEGISRHLEVILCFFLRGSIVSFRGPQVLHTSLSGQSCFVVRSLQLQSKAPKTESSSRQAEIRPLWPLRSCATEAERARRYSGGQRIMRRSEDHEKVQ